MNILIVVDNALRDLYGLINVSNSIHHNNDCQITLCDNSTLGILAFKHYDFVILPYIRNDNYNLIKFLNRINTKICIIETEGAIIQNLDLYYKNVANIIKQTDFSLYFTWGDLQKRTLLKYLSSDSPHSPQKIYSYGSPRFDIYKKKKFKVNNNIVIITNQAIYNPRYKSQSDETKALVSLHNWSKDFLNNWILESEIVFNQYHDLILKLSSIFSDRQITIRVHPYENPNTYLDIKRDNVKVDLHSDINSLILDNYYLIHRNSSVAVEAAVLHRKIPIQINWPSLNTIKQMVPYNLSIHANSFDELIEILNSRIEHRKIDTSYLKDLYGDLNNTSAKLISEIIYKNCFKLFKKLNFFQLLFYFIFYLRIFGLKKIFILFFPIKKNDESRQISEYNIQINLNNLLKVNSCVAKKNFLMVQFFVLNKILTS